MLTFPGDRLAPSWSDGAEPSVDLPLDLPVDLPAALRGAIAAPAPAVDSRLAALVEPLPPPAVGLLPTPAPVQQATTRKAAKPAPAFVEPKGCLYALSQPPLMLFLCLIGALIGGGAAWDLIFL